MATPSPQKRAIVATSIFVLFGMLGAILAADERGQGQPYADAMDRARLVISNNRPKGP